MWLFALLLQTATADDPLKLGLNQSRLWIPEQKVAFIDAPADTVAVRGTWTPALHLRGERVGTWPLAVHFEDGTEQTLVVEVVDAAFSPHATRTVTLGVGSVLLLDDVGFVDARGSRGLHASTWGADAFTMFVATRVSRTGHYDLLLVPEPHRFDGTTPSSGDPDAIEIIAVHAVEAPITQASNAVEVAIGEEHVFPDMDDLELAPEDQVDVWQDGNGFRIRGESVGAFDLVGHRDGEPMLVHVRVVP